MKIPIMMVLKIRNEGKGVSLYIFLPLIYLLLLPLLIIGTVIYALMVAFRTDRRIRDSALKMLVYLPRLMTAAWGTEIDIHSDVSDVRILVK